MWRWESHELVTVCPKPPEGKGQGLLPTLCRPLFCTHNRHIAAVRLLHKHHSSHSHRLLRTPGHTYSSAHTMFCVLLMYEIRRS